MAQKPKQPTYTTPLGAAVWPKLDKPDTKFKVEGEFSIKLRLSEKEAAKVRKIIDAAVPEAKAKLAAFVKEQAKTGKRPKVAGVEMNVPYSVVVDDQGEETGELEFKFAAKASGVRKDGTPWRKERIPTFDRFGVAEAKPVYGGSKVVVSYAVNTYATPAVWGVSLRLEAVMVKELVSAGQKSASGFGFDVDAREDDEDDDSSESTSSDEGSDGAAETPDF